MAFVRRQRGVADKRATGRAHSGRLKCTANVRIENLQSILLQRSLDTHRKRDREEKKAHKGRATETHRCAPMWARVYAERHSIFLTNIRIQPTENIKFLFFPFHYPADGGTSTPPPDNGEKRSSNQRNACKRTPSVVPM